MASIKKRPDGKWRARYRDHNGKEIARHFDRKVDAEKYINEVTASVVTGQYVDPSAGKVKFADYYARWSARQIWATGTKRAMDLAAGGVTFSSTQMSAIKRHHVEDWVKSISHLAPSTVRTRFNNVRGVFKGAVADRIIATDPTDGVTLPRLRRADAAMEIPTTAEVGRLLDAAEPVFRGFLAVCAFAGLRMGEACGLQRGDYDKDAQTLVIRRQIQRQSGKNVEILPPKYGSERTVYIPQALCEMLDKHIANYAGDSWLFPGESGLPWHQNTAGYYLRKTRTKVGVDYTLHELRHYFASGLIFHGADVVTVQRALGHQTATVTLNTYSHLWPSAADKTRAASAEMMRAALSSGDQPPFSPGLVMEGHPVDLSEPQLLSAALLDAAEGEDTGTPADGRSEPSSAD